MLTVAVIAFREFLEAFLIFGVFLGISKKLKLKKELEIWVSASLGVITSFSLAIATYFFGDQARGILSESNADLLSSYLLIFSGIFIAYVVFSLHNRLGKGKKAALSSAQANMQNNVFDISLFFTLFFLILREGFEIALFTASTSLFSAFVQNAIGLAIGFSIAAAIGLSVALAFVKFPIKKVFKVTEYMIIILGASLVQNGLTKLFKTHFDISLSKIFPFNFHFLPDQESLIGHLLKSFFGLDREFSGMRLAIMGVFIGIVYVSFLKKNRLPDNRS